MKWQPIETAPRDGTVVWLAFDTGPRKTDWYFRACQYTNGGNNFCKPGWYLSNYGALGAPIYFEPTHWMPLPEPPDD